MEKFGAQVDCRNSMPMADKLSTKGAWICHVTHLNFESHLKYVWNG